MSTGVVNRIELESLPLFSRGKVRETFILPDGLLLMVATDRISAYDSILPSPIPSKGIVLTQLSRFWFGQMAELAPNHLVTTDVAQISGVSDSERELLRGRSMIVRQAERIDVECVARGYLAGSAWAEYQQSQTVCGISLPPGLIESDQLPEPIYTPANKSDSGHDENISFEDVIEKVGDETARQLRDLTLSIYSAAAEYARSRGILLADTKFEFGIIDGEIALIDELITPDSSRFWDAALYEPGRSQPSFDKQFVRDWLTSAGWDREPPAPALPDDVARATSERYMEAYERLVGRSLYPLD